MLVPTRELASQVADVLASLDGGRGLRVAQLIGGRPLCRSVRRCSRRAVVVGAPGRVLDHLRQGNLNLRMLRFVVLDEADQMLDAGFAPDIERILAMTPPAARWRFSPPRCLSGPSDRRALPARIRCVWRHARGDLQPVPRHCPGRLCRPSGPRLDALIALLDRRRDAEGTTLVFGRTKHGVKKLARQLRRAAIPSPALQGNMSQNARDRVVADFRAGRVPVLLATNVAARGLDVSPSSRSSTTSCRNPPNSSPIASGERDAWTARVRPSR